MRTLRPTLLTPFNLSTQQCSLQSLCLEHHIPRTDLSNWMFVPSDYLPSISPQHLFLNK